MRQLSSTGQRLVDDIAQRHGFSGDATMSMLDAVIAGNGSMAQFSHPEFAGSGQWMRGGMTMVSDMFNNQLKNRVDALCSDLSRLAANQPDLLRSGSFQSQRQGDSGGQAQTSRHDGGPTQHQDGAGSNSSDPSGGSLASLFVPPAPGESADWWPSDLRYPNSTGAQNGVRYAYFSQAHRLVIDVAGTVTVYDTLDHRIGGFSQQQSVGGTLGFSSQHGAVDVTRLPVVSSNGRPPAAPAHEPSREEPPARANAGGDVGRQQREDVFATLERLADLKAKGIVSDEEFSRKKAELLSRM